VEAVGPRQKWAYGQGGAQTKGARGQGGPADEEGPSTKRALRRRGGVMRANRSCAAAPAALLLCSVGVAGAEVCFTGRQAARCRVLDAQHRALLAWRNAGV